MKKQYFQPISLVRVGATEGTENYQTAKKVFSVWLDPDFQNWGIVFSGLSEPADIIISNIVETGRFQDFFGKKSEQLELYRIHGSKFLKLCRDYPHKLYNEGMGASFAVLTANNASVTKDLSNVFIGCITFKDINLIHACIHKVTRDHLWEKGKGYQAFYPI